MWAVTHTQGLHFNVESEAVVNVTSVPTVFKEEAAPNVHPHCKALSRRPRQNAWVYECIVQYEMQLVNPNPKPLPKFYRNTLNI